MTWQATKQPACRPPKRTFHRKSQYLHWRVSHSRIELSDKTCTRWKTTQPLTRDNSSYKLFVFWCPEGDLNPHDLLESADFKSAASANFAIRAPKAMPTRIMVPEGANQFLRNLRIPFFRGSALQPSARGERRPGRTGRWMKLAY